VARKFHWPDWLRAPKVPPGGRVALADHLREIRYRFLVSMAAIILMTILATIFERQLLQVVLWPIQRAVTIYQTNRPGGQVQMVTQGVSAGFSLYFKVCFMAGFIATCPVWLFQLWRFIVPALKQGERRVALQFIGASVPLFLAGVALGYSLCPNGFAVLMNFNPPSVTNLNDVGTFLSFELRLLLVFGLAFLLPVLLVSLNRLGIVTGVMLGKARNVAIVLCAVFAAVATPTTDPLTMLAMMVPMVAMYIVAEIICRRNDRRKLGKSTSTAVLAG